jgi:hypothetical protein
LSMSAGTEGACSSFRETKTTCKEPELDSKDQERRGRRKGTWFAGHPIFQGQHANPQRRVTGANPSGSPARGDVPHTMMTSDFPSLEKLPKPMPRANLMAAARTSLRDAMGWSNNMPYAWLTARACAATCQPPRPLSLALLLEAHKPRVQHHMQHVDLCGR